jgi:hypothetical protein
MRSTYIGPTTMSAIADALSSPVPRRRGRSMRKSRSTVRKSMSKQTDTGRRDAKGRIIWRGPRGGIFVRGRNNQKVKPAMGG